MISRRTLATLLIIALPLIPAGGWAATITFKPEATVNGPRVSLGDVAVVTDATPEMIEIFHGIDMGTAPWPGSVRRVDGLVVKLKLYQNGIDPKQIKINAKDCCLLRTRGIEVPAETIVKLAREHLIRNSRWPRGDLEVKLVSTPTGRLVPAGCGADAVRPTKNQTFRRLGRVQVGIDIVVEGIPRFRENVAFDVKLFEKAVVVTRDIARGEILGTDNVGLLRIEIKRWPSNRITNAAHVLGAAAKVPLSAGTPIVSAMIEEPLVIRRGDIVKLIYETGRLKVTTSGIAKQDGTRGQNIAVQNIDSKKLLVGRVLDSKTIRIGG